jgi:Mg-chelatase subunit ChlD
LTAAAALEALAGATAPFLIGVRHHSPACAAAVPPLLDQFAPTRLLVELPAELGKLLPLLGNPTLEPPVALTAVRENGRSLYFYPFAEFSPELAAVRWAVARGVPVEAFDRPYLASSEPAEVEPAREVGPLTRALCDNLAVEGTEALWDVLIEGRANGADPESTRRAALLFGWALRADEHANGGVRERDLARERYMRGRLARVPDDRVAVVVGSFHASALTPTPLLGEVETDDVTTATPPDAGMVSSLIPYSFDLFDSRSGYPAGIRDPMWQARAYAALVRQEPLENAVAESLTAIARAIRERGHVASFPDVREALRLARDLSHLRNLPGPGRRELVEAIETTMGQGELLGRGRVLGRAMQRVLVGNRRGRLPEGAPRSGLGPHVEALLVELGLPGATETADDPKWLVLDPLRSALDRRREVALRRLEAADVPYAERDVRQGATGAEFLTTRWSAQYTPATAAMLELSGLRGVTLAQVAEGALRRRLVLDDEGKEPSLQTWLETVEAAAHCGLPELLRELLVGLARELGARGGLSEVVSGLFLFERLESGHVAGAPTEPTDGLPGFQLPEAARRADLLGAAVRAVEGMQGSRRLEDVHALRELLGLIERQRSNTSALGESRLGAALDALERDGSPLMQGAAGAARVLLERSSAEALGVVLGSQIDGAVDLATSEALAQRLQGALAFALPLFEAHPSFIASFLERIDALEDGAFLRRLPALRAGFEVLSPAARARLLAAFEADDAGGSLQLDLLMAPELLAEHAAADREGALAVTALGLSLVERFEPAATTLEPRRWAQHHALPMSERLRLLLGRERQRLSPHAARYASALDELYGRGRGEGSRADSGAGGGTGPAFPTVREWAEELSELFGGSVRDEVLGRALNAGRPAAALALDPDSVTPSIELLEQVLSLKGGLAERDLARLRALVQRIVDELVQALARRVRPALAGLVTARSTRQKHGPLDLRRTVLANLRAVRPDAAGRLTLVPEELWFRRRGKRALDYHVVLVVDVSGSMEPSVIYSAMMAAILNGLPALSVRFVAFNDQVMDFSERVDDPLGLLLEVRIGGGTSIAQGLRYARGLLKVPARSMVLCVSDFEEGVSLADVLAEVRAIRETGAKLLGLAALDERGAPRYQRAIAEQMVEAGMPIAALSPLELARWVGEQIR